MQTRKLVFNCRFQDVRLYVLAAACYRLLELLGVVPVAVIVGFVAHVIVVADILRSAGCTKDNASQDEVEPVATLLVIVPFPGNALDTIKQILGYDRLMLALVHQSSPPHLAVIEMVLQYFRELALADSFSGAGTEPFLMYVVHDGAHRIVSSRVHPECFCYERGVDRIDDDGSLVGVVRLADVEISNGSMCRPAAVPELLLHALDGLARGDLGLELVHSGNDQVHEVPLGTVLNRRLGNGYQLDIVLFQDCLDGEVVAGISRESVGILDKDRSDALVLLHPQDHVLQSRTVHVGGAFARILVDAVFGKLVRIACLDGFLAEPKLSLEGLSVALGLLLGGDSAVDECFLHGDNGISLVTGANDTMPRKRNIAMVQAFHW